MTLESMNSRARVISTLKHQKADRVPIGEMWIDAKVVRGIMDSDSSNDLVDYLDLDIVTAATMVYEEDEVKWEGTRGERRLLRDKWGALQILMEDVLGDYTLDRGDELRLDPSCSKELPKVLLAYIYEKAEE